MLADPAPDHAGSVGMQASASDKAQSCCQAAILCFVILIVGHRLLQPTGASAVPQGCLEGFSSGSSTYSISSICLYRRAG